VIVRDGVLDFDAMQMRLHPAESRIKRLSAEIPAEYVVFDVLLWDGDAVWKRPLEERRAELENVAKGFRLSPAVRDVKQARGGLDYVGSCAVGASMRKEVAARVLPLVEPSKGERVSEPNRWGSGELEEAPVKPKLVIEVRYDKVQGSRFRHGTKFIRWREDKDPADCTWRELRPPKTNKSVEELFL